MSLPLPPSGVTRAKARGPPGFRFLVMKLCAKLTMSLLGCLGGTMLKRTVVTAGLFLLVFAVVAPASWAASPHFKRGGEPVCTISTSGSTATVTCTGSLAGLGNADLKINVTTAGFAVYQCQNNGGNTAPGQNRVLEGPTTTPTIIPSGEIKNGNLAFTATGTLTASSTVSGAAAGCPGANWTGVNPTLTGHEHLGELRAASRDAHPDHVLGEQSERLSGTVSLTC
jgi:hypothetical protein